MTHNLEPFKMIEPLEPRQLFSFVDTSSVSFYTAAGQAGAQINRHLALVVLIHGDSMNPSEMVETATAVQDQLPASQYQVLILDWSALADSGGNTSRDALAVGTWLAATIEKSRIPVSRVNLMGFSAGGTVMERAARDLKTKTTEVNSIIGEDPAAGRYEAPEYAATSKYSFAFCGNDIYGGTQASLSAQDAVLVTNIDPNNQLFAHADVFTVVTNIWDQDAGLINSGDQAVCELFSVPNLFAGAPLAWKKHTVIGNFEGSLRTNGDYSNPLAASFTYVNSRGHTITVS